MAVFKVVRRVTAAPRVVWSVLSDVVGFADAAPNLSRAEILEGERLGLRRRNYDRGGRAWDEICISWEDNHHYTMLVDTGDYPYPFLKMQRTLAMEERTDDVLVTVEYEYVPKYGVVGRLLDRLTGRRQLEKVASGILNNLVKRVRDREWIYTVNVDSILGNKGGHVITVTPETSIIEMGRLLAEKRIGSVLALDDDGKIAGVVSERDIVMGIAQHGAEVLERPVSDIMTRKVVVCSPEDTMMHVMACMTDRRVRHLPVMDGDELLGIISIGDVVKARIANLESESEGMREYIAGRKWREHYIHTGLEQHEAP